MRNEEELVPELFSKKKKGKRKRSTGEHRDGWENLGQRGVIRIDANIEGGITGVRTGDISAKGLPRTGRRLLAIGRSARQRFQRVSRDGDGDGKWTNPLTGEDTLPYNPANTPAAVERAADISLPDPKDVSGLQRRKFLSDMENHVMRLSTGGLDSFEVELADNIAAAQLRGRVHYWNRTGTRDVKTSYRQGKFRAYATTGPSSGRNVVITGAMSGPYTNKSPYIGDDVLIEHQAEQTKEFKSWAEKEEWGKFHFRHYDWWTFPIDKGSGPYGFMYDVSGEPLERLKKNVEYLTSLRDAASLYMLSLGWNMAKGWWIRNPHPDQTPNGNINQQRLFKIGRSLQIHELDESFESVQKMVATLRRNGVSVGNEGYWDNPSRYVPKSRYKDSSGITGSMAGISLQPTAFKGMQSEFDPLGDKKFRAIWDGRDERAAIGDESRGDITFDWKDDNARKALIQRIWKGQKQAGFADFEALISPGIKHSDSAKTGLSPVLKDHLDLIAAIGLHWTLAIGKGGYPGFRDQYGTVFTHSKTPVNPETAAGEQARDLLGYLAPTINPKMYWGRFEAWIRNPFSVMRTPNGNEVGVRLFFNDDRQKLVAEFNKRIARLYAAIAEGHGYNPDDKPFTPLPGQEVVDTYSPDDVLEYVRRQMDALINSPDLPMHQTPTVEGLRKELVAYMAAANDKMKDNLIPITPAWFEEYLKRNHPGYLRQTMSQNPAFLRRTEADSLEADQRRELTDLVSIILGSPNDRDRDVAELKKLYFSEPYYTIEMIQEELNRQTAKLGGE
jgi:hypothetical protein